MDAILETTSVAAMVYSESQLEDKTIHSTSHIKHAFRFMGHRPLNFNFTVCLKKKNNKKGLTDIKSKVKATEKQQRTRCARTVHLLLALDGCYK